MRRLFSVLLALLLLAAALPASAAATVVSVALSEGYADTDGVDTSFTIDDVSRRSEFARLIGTMKTVALAQETVSGIKNLSRLTFELSDGSQRVYNLGQSGDGNIYAYVGPQLYQLDRDIYYKAAEGYALRTPVVSLENDSTYPGELVIIRVKDAPAGAKLTALTYIGFTPSFFREADGDYVALLPVSCYVAPGNHPVAVSLDGKTVASLTVTVSAKQFVRQNLTVPPATADETINSQKANAEYEQYIAPLRRTADANRYWSGRFIWPVKDQWKRTTAFGTLRYTNGSTTPSIHAALDMASPLGTPVYATGAGKVLYSGFLQLTGNTIVIEHGYGLKSWYYHLDSLSVKTGDSVEQEQLIGTMGTTGFSTGSHLHFAMSAGNPASGQYFINPETLITSSLAE